MRRLKSGQWQRSIFLSLVLMAFCGFACAEQKRILGNWEVHYIAFNTTFLTPEIASANGISRSPNNILINISVLDRTTKLAQSVDITGTARNLLGNTKVLNFKKVEEGDAIYYLAQLPFSDEEHYRFNIEIIQGKVEQTLKFEQKLYR